MTFFLFNNTFAQQASTSSNVSANILTPLSINTTGSIDFGDIVLTQSAQNITKAPNEGSTGEVTGNPSSNITINFNPVTLDNSAWASQHNTNIGTITFNPLIHHTGSNSNYINPQQVTNGGTYQLIDIGGVGKLYLWIGGTITVQPNQPIGYYTGTLTINVAY